MKNQGSREQLLKSKNKNYEYKQYNRSSSNSQLSMSPGHWKTYLIHNEASTNRAGRSSSNKVVSPVGMTSQYQKEDSHQHNYYLNEQAQKKREDMIKRVKEIQDKVMPILKSENRKANEEEDVSWQNRMEEKILRLQTSLDSLEKGMQIQLEKRIMEMEEKWQTRFDELLRNSRTKYLGDSSRLDQQRRNYSEIEETD